MTNHLLSLLIFLPLLALVILTGIPREKIHWFKGLTLLTNAVQFLMALALYSRFNPALRGVNRPEEFQYTERLDWISLDMGEWGKLSIDYFVGVDGLSALMVLLSGLVLLAILPSTCC
jgi:NADH-quinone oxidoreductase subunit M